MGCAASQAAWLPKSATACLGSALALATLHRIAVPPPATAVAALAAAQPVRAPAAYPAWR